MISTRWFPSLRWCAALILVLFAGLWGRPSAAQPPAQQAAGMPDPRAMSGMPRVDPNLASGTVTVRCLLGSFAEPAIGVDVEIALTTADGSRSETRKATAADKGRAVFDGLDDFVGGTAVASAMLGGEVVRSAPIRLDAAAGTAVLLVKGAGTPNTPGASPAASGAPGGHGGDAPSQDDPHAGAGSAGHAAGMPEPGRPFPLRERPDGTLIVGVFDLSTSQPVIGASARLHVDLPGDAPDPEPIERQSGADGRVMFEELAGEAYPAGTKFRVEAAVESDQPMESSQPFEMTGGHGWALVFIRGSQARQAAAASTSVRPTGPRSDSSLAAGTVALLVTGGDAKPVPDLAVTVVQQTMRGAEQRYGGRTNEDGVAEITGVPVANDALYFAVAPYDGAPFRSPMFRLDGQRGARVDLVVRKVTGDVSRFRSAAQFDVVGLEDDRARVLHMFEAVLEGEEAFWVPGFRMQAAAGGTGVRVMRGAEAHLRELDDAPYAELVEPLMPGERLVLSIAYLMRHDGELDFEWHAPFPVADARASMETGLRVDAGASGPAEAPKSETHGGPPVHLFPLEIAEFVDGPCQQRWKSDPSSSCDALDQGGAVIAFTVSGLVAESPVFRYLALGIAGVLVLAVGIGLAGGRVSPRDALVRKRDALLERVKTLDPQRDRSVYERAIAALDRIYRQLDAFEAKPASTPATTAESSTTTR